MGLTQRDKNIICAIGDYKILSQDQILSIKFKGADFTTKSGYYVWRRRYREEISKYLDEPFYINVSRSGERLPLFRLNKKGKVLYQDLTGTSYRIPQWNYRYIPHLMETNWLIIKLGSLIDSFQHEFKQSQFSTLQMDALCRTKNRKKIALEIDLSESETKEEIVDKFKKYQLFYNKNKFPHYLIFYSNRATRINEWISPYNTSDLIVMCVKRNDDSLNKAIQYIKKDHPIMGGL